MVRAGHRVKRFLNENLNAHILGIFSLIISVTALTLTDYVLQLSLHKNSLVNWIIESFFSKIIVTKIWPKPRSFTHRKIHQCFLAFNFINKLLSPEVIYGFNIHMLPLKFTVITTDKLTQGWQSILFQNVTHNEEETVLNVKWASQLSLNLTLQAFIFTGHDAV